MLVQDNYNNAWKCIVQNFEVLQAYYVKLTSAREHFYNEVC
jgi:hypothetical protein